MGRMKYGKPQPHANKKKVVVVTKSETKEGDDGGDQAKKENDGFSRRLLDSNHDRYDEPIEFEDSDEDLYQEDETKSIEYIKKHYSGVSSHFQFQEEKEWQVENKEDEEEEDILRLNLNQLSRDICNINLFEKLQLNDLDPEVKYCVAKLAELSEMTETSKPAFKSTSPINQAPSFEWSFKGIERFQAPKRKPTLKNCKSADGSINEPISDSNDRPNATATEDITTSQKTLSNENETKLNVFQESDKNETLNDDVELDDLLEIPPTPPSQDPTKQSGDNTLREAHLKESGAKELDDWLDSILD